MNNKKNKKSVKFQKLLKKTVTILSVLVVFLTSYFLVLPAITIDKQTADEEGGIVIEKKESDEKEELELSDPDYDDDTLIFDDQENNVIESSEPEIIENKTETSELDNSEILSYPEQTLEGYLEDTLVIVNAPEGSLPEGTQMVLEEIKVDNNLIFSVNDTLSEKKVDQIKAIDISFIHGEEKVEPFLPVRVSITSSFIQENSDDALLYHISDNGNVDQIEANIPDVSQLETISDEHKQVLEDIDKIDEINTDNTLSFEADSFSVYVIVYTVERSEYSIGADSETYKITVSFDDDAVIPEEAHLQVRELLQGTEEYEKYISMAADEMNIEENSIAFARFFDIGIMLDGEKIEPAAPVKVEIAYADPLDIDSSQRLGIIHFGDEKTEIISDPKLDEENNTITYRQDGFSVTGTVVQNLQADRKYVMIVEHESRYYVIENDGTLRRISNSDIEFNQDGSVKTVSLVNPIFWTYTDIGYNNYNIYHDTDAYEPYHWTSLPLHYIRRYLNVDTDSGMNDVKEELVDKWHEAVQYNNNNHRINHYDNYLGVYQDENGVLRIRGKCNYDGSTIIHFAEAQSVSDVSIRDHVVNHIDISVVATSGIRVPLAYGSYRLAEVDENGDMTGNYREEPLIVSRENNVTLEVEKKVPITVDDLKKADISAFTLNSDGSRKNKDDAYIVTGYSRNASTESDTSQIRLEGSFKVADLPRVPNHLEENDSGICSQRLQNRIYYEVSLTKPVTFRMTYVDENSGKTYAVLKDETTPFDITVDVNLSSSFDFWDESNTCPGVRDIFSPDVWLTGVIPDNGKWNEDNGADGGPGMDFRLGAPVDDTRHDIVAVEITKYIQDVDGNLIPLKIEHDCNFSIYQGDSVNDMNYLHDKKMNIGANGVGILYDYDVTGGTYSNPRYAQITESAESIEDVIIDAYGNEWKYDHTRIDTEYVWRDFGNPELHIGEKENKKDGNIASDVEILGEYQWDHFPENYEYDGEIHNGNEYNRFLEFYAYNVYRKVEKVNVPVEKTWDDFDVEGADWSATLRLQWAPIYEGQTEVGAPFEDVIPIREITVTKNMMAQGDASLGQRTFSDLPKYGYDEDRECYYRIQYSLEEMSYYATKDGITYTFNRSTTPGVPDEYSPDGIENQFTAFYPHDAGEISEADEDYFIVVSNHQRSSKDKKYIEVVLTKTWSDATITDDDFAFAKFNLYYNKRTDYRDISRMSEADKQAEPIIINLKDSNGKLYDTITVQPHTGLRISITRKGKTGNSTYSISGGDYSPSSSNTIDFYYNTDKETKYFGGKAYPSNSCDIILSGDLDYIDSAKLYDTTPGTVTETGILYKQILLNKENHWFEELNLLHEETVTGGDANNENVEVYEYYFEEVQSNPDNFYVTFYEFGTDNYEGDEYNVITSDDHIDARNEPAPVLQVLKAWRGVPDSEGYPTVYFTLYQCKAGTDNIGNAHVYVGEEYPYEGASSKSYENIPLSSSTNEDNNYIWRCPEVLPLRDENGNRLAYFVVETPRQGNVGGTGWSLYGYSQGYDSETGRIISNALPDQPYNAQIVGNKGTLMIHNKVERFHEMDIKKQYFAIWDAGSWANVTDGMTSDVVLGFKVIRRIVSKDGNTHITGWTDYGDEMLVGYDSDNNPVQRNGNNDFHLQYAGLWHWTIHDQEGDLNSEHIGLPLEGFYTDPNTHQTIAVNYQYSFRETNVYKDLDRNPYPEWTWYSTIVPDQYLNQNGQLIQGEFGLAFPNQDSERIANYQASDLNVIKRWLGKPNAEEVYVKIWRKLGEEGTPEDFTEEIAKDVAGDYPDSHPAHGNTNWQNFVDDPTSVDTENNWLILKSNTSGKWETHIRVQNALIKTTGVAASQYIYYIEEVGYKDNNGNVHKKSTEDLSELETHYTRWIDGRWEVSPSISGSDKAISLGATGENRLQVMNSPEMDLTVKKVWLDEEGNPLENVPDSITFKIEQLSTKYNINGEPTDESRRSFVSIDGKSVFNINKENNNAHWVINVDHSDHSQYDVDRNDPSTNDDGESWTFYIDGLQEGYFDADNSEWHCKYFIKEIEIPGFDSIVSNDGVSSDGEIITVTNTKSNNSAVKIKKVFDGLDSLPDGFAINASWNDGTEHSISLEVSDQQPDNVLFSGDGSSDNPYIWIIRGLPIIDPALEVSFTESGFEVENMIVTVSSESDQYVNKDNPSTKVVVASDKINEGDFRNIYSPIGTDINLLKYDDKTNANLGGALFSLLRSDAAEGAYVAVTELEEVALDDLNRFVIPVDGLELKGLTSGYYIVREEVSPAGYVIRNKDAVRFAIGSDGTVTNISDTTISFEPESNLFKIPNEPGKEFPSTGGIGNGIFYCTGIAIIITSFVILISRKRFVK